MFNKEREKQYKLGKTILNESDLKIQIPYKGDIFTLQYPNPMLRTAIETEIARRLGGYPRSSFSPDHIATIEATVTIDILMIRDECPDWFEGPWTCYDDALIANLYDGYLRFRDEFRKKLRSDRLEGDNKGGGT